MHHPVDTTSSDGTGTVDSDADALISAYGERSVRIAEQKAIAADFFGHRDLAQRWLAVAERAARRLAPSPQQLNGD
jgi:hypothetical protein